MKVISYSLFKADKEPFEKMAYVRGLYWNSRMNNFIYPDWRTHLEVDRATYNEYQLLFDWLVENNTLDLKVIEKTPTLCAGMLWRMKPLFTLDISHVLCRDCDSITTYREALMVQKWLESGLAVHGLLDNPAHGGLMGGMVGFNTAKIKAIMGWHNWNDIVLGYDLANHGSDQALMNQKIYPSVVNSELMLERVEIPIEYRGNLPGVSEALWESNLVCRHIGSAGVVEMELLRFFKRFDEYNWKFQAIEKQIPKLFYWWNL